MALSNMPVCVRCRRFEKIKRKGLQPSPLDYVDMPAHDEWCQQGLYEGYPGLALERTT